MVLRLSGLAGIANCGDGKLGVLNAHFLFGAGAQGAAIETNDGRVAEVGINPIEAGRIGHGDIGVIGPGHGLGHGDLLLLGRIHITLTANDQFGALHGAVAPDFGIVAVIADDQADLQALGAVVNIGAVTRIPALDRHPRHDLAVFLNDFTLIVHQYQRVVRGLVRVLFVPFPGQRKDPPDLGVAAGFGKDVGLCSGAFRSGFVHLFFVVHDAV